MAEILSMQYQSVFSEPSHDSIYSDRNVSITCSISDIVFSMDDIIDAIDELSYSSGSGPMASQPSF